MKEYTVNEGEFTFRDYEKQPAFSSFLPGLTGEDGIPMWVFYTNRGQAIGSVGINSKSEAIMEFTPACTEYENTELKGYRTFIRTEGRTYEPFRYEGSPIREMKVRKNSLRISEEAPEYGLRITVDYFVLPRESIGALCRLVRLENLTGRPIKAEVLDGVSRIIPRGISNGQFEEMGNLFKSWTDVKNTEEGAPFFAMRASTDDSSEVEEIKGGYFYAGCMDGELLPFVCDSEEVFGYDTALCSPRNFSERGAAAIAVNRPVYNKVPCAFSVIDKTLEAGRSISWISYLGYAPSTAELNGRLAELKQEGMGERAFVLAEELCNELTGDVRTSTALPEFDKYIEQCYLDNFLRGGYPVTVGSGDNTAVLYLYSRKHGDPERDYNYFTIDGAYYSQGNGNFRDVCQNRRNDVFFCPEMGDYNVRSFMNLIQLDGYNPLEIRPAAFRLREGMKDEALQLLETAVGERAQELGKLLDRSFKPGDIFRTFTALGLKSSVNPKKLMEKLLPLCEELNEAGAGEGYWSDHWDYCLDLIENYLSVFPDKEGELLQAGGYRYFDNEMTVRERKDTYVLSGGRVWQFGSMVRDAEKMGRPGFTPNASNWKKNADGSLTEVNLAAKLLSLILIKYATLDAYGMGIEMEGGKPGWNDAMNGLPGMLASSMPEAFELARLNSFLLRGLDTMDERSIDVPEELGDFFKGLQELSSVIHTHSPFNTSPLEDGIGEDDPAFRLWDARASLREGFREKTRLSSSGRRTELDIRDVRSMLEQIAAELEEGAALARRLSGGNIPTYFTYRVTKYSILKDAEGNTLTDEAGRPKVRALGLKAEALPLFLEGFARYLNKGAADASEVYGRVKESGLYDSKLGMYRTSESLEALSLQYGRIRAFTPGWLERESIFLHMEYKYLLALLKNGLYNEFYDALKTAFVPFMDPAVYGRSILENSSFIASSANPDPKVHGRGYVARLSGSTTEVLTMWIRMFIGPEVFTCGSQGLDLKLAPVLPAYFFDGNGEASWTFMGRTRIVYVNKSGRDTYGRDAASVRRMKLLTVDGNTVEIEGSSLGGTYADMVRDGRIVRIDAYME